MQRVNLGKPYEEYIKKMVASGYFASASEVIRDALRDKMEGKPRPKTLKELVKEGEDDVKAGRVVEYNEDFLDMIKTGAEEKIRKGLPVSDHIKP